MTEDSDEKVPATAKFVSLDSTSNMIKSKSEESDGSVHKTAGIPSSRISRVDTRTSIEMRIPSKHDIPLLTNANNNSNTMDSRKGMQSNEQRRGTTADPKINMVDIIRRKASHAHTDAHVDNSMLLSKMPKLQDITIDDNTRATTVLHFILTLISIVLFVFGCLGNDIAFYILGIIAIVSNTFGILHSMYAGSETSKAHRLDHALQNLAQIISKFARALDIQETHLDSVRSLLDYFDNSMNKYEANMNNTSNSQSSHPKSRQNQKQFIAQSEFYFQTMHQINLQHKAWLISLFRQFRLLDNRFGITKEEYDEFISKLPIKTRKIFDKLKVSVENRFRVLLMSDPEAIRQRTSRRRLSKLEEETQGHIKVNKTQRDVTTTANTATEMKEEDKSNLTPETKDSKDNTKIDAVHSSSPVSGSTNLVTPIVSESSAYPGIQPVQSVSTVEQESKENDGQTVTLVDKSEWQCKVLFYNDFDAIVKKVINDLFENDQLAQQDAGYNEADNKDAHLLLRRMSEGFDSDKMMHATIESVRNRMSKETETNTANFVMSSNSNKKTQLSHETTLTENSIDVDLDGLLEDLQESDEN